MITTSIKSYSELMQFSSFIDRYQYLRCDSHVGEETFGCDRYLNQILYHSYEWKLFRRKIIIRDKGCDLGHEDHQIPDNMAIIIHHINPITVSDILQRNPMVLDPENAISTILLTHNAIHYGNETLLTNDMAERTPYDTCPWKL